MPLWLVPVVAIVGLLAVWLPVMLVSLLFSGWYELARRFPSRPPALRARRGVGSLFLSPIFRYNRVIAFVDDEDMLHLRLPPVLGAFHAPLSIPWAAIDLDEADRRVSGMVPAVVAGRRVLLSPQMVKRELEVRRAIAEMASSDTAAGDEAS